MNSREEIPQDQQAPLSQLLQQQGRGYLQQGAAQSVNPLAAGGAMNQPGSAPINQQSFSDPNAIPVSSRPAAPAAPMFVRGVGMMGPDLGGYVKGVQAAQDYQLKAADNRRAEEQQGMNKVRIGMEQDYLNMAKSKLGADLALKSTDLKDKERLQAIQAGMDQAAQEGGLGAVLDYLQTADPIMGAKILGMKSELDMQMMQNETYKIAHGNDKAKALMEGYSLLGGMGASLLKTAPENREQAWQAMAPIAKQVDPSLPDKLDNSVVTKLGLGMALSTPAAQLYAANMGIMRAQTELGKTMSDYTQVVSKYGADSKEAKMMNDQINSLSQKEQINQVAKANQLAQTKNTGENQLRQQWIGLSKGYEQMNQSNAAVQQAVQTQKDAKGNVIKGPNDMAIIYNYYKMLDPSSVIMPGEYANAENTGGWDDKMRVQYNKIQKGDKLSDAQRISFAQSAQQLLQSKQQNMYSLRSQYEEIAGRNGFNPQNVTVGSLPRAPDAAIQFLQKNPTPEMQQQFQYKYGQDALNQALGR